MGSSNPPEAQLPIRAASIMVMARPATACTRYEETTVTPVLNISFLPDLLLLRSPVLRARATKPRPRPWYVRVSRVMRSKQLSPVTFSIRPLTIRTIKPAKTELGISERRRAGIRRRSIFAKSMAPRSILSSIMNVHT